LCISTADFSPDFAPGFRLRSAAPRKQLRRLTLFLDAVAQVSFEAFGMKNLRNLIPAVSSCEKSKALADLPLLPPRCRPVKTVGCRPTVAPEIPKLPPFRLRERDTGVQMCAPLAASARTFTSESHYAAERRACARNRVAVITSTSGSADWVSSISLKRCQNAEAGAAHPHRPASAVNSPPFPQSAHRGARTHSSPRHG